MPFKLNQDRRHPIPRQRHKVTNWPDYEASLRQRASLTVWFTEEAITSKTMLSNSGESCAAVWPRGDAEHDPDVLAVDLDPLH